MAKRRLQKQTKSRFTPWLLAVGVVGLLLVAAFVWRERNFIFPPNIAINKEEMPVYGIDVSYHNGNVDFERVAATGVKFVYIKSTEGRKNRDPKFKTNARKAAKAGLETGAYHFFRMGKDGVEQANNMLSATKGVPLTLPMCIDVEDAHNDKVQRAQVLKRLRDMVLTLQRAGHRVIIYTNRNGFDKYVRGRYKHVDVWLASFRNPKTMRNSGVGHVIQQYSHVGEVDGVNGDVDLDVFFGTPAEWRDWVNAKPDY